MTTGLYNDVNDALLDAIALNGVTFTWKSGNYDCILNGDSASLVAPKSEFGNSSYPNRGDTIRVQGKNMQVVAIGNATSAFADGGIIDVSTPFTDDPTNPSLLIAYRPFIDK